MPLELYAHKLALLDVSDSTTVTVATAIPGYEVVGVAMPAALNPNGSTEVNFQVNPGDGIFRTVVDDSGTELVLTNITQGEVVQVQEGKPPICGAQIRLVLGAAEVGGADLKFFLLLKELH